MSEPMTFTAVLLGTVEEQMAAGDVNVIDPEVIDLTEWTDGRRTGSPVFAEGRYRVPEDIVGSWQNPRVEDGRLLADIHLLPEYAPHAPKIRYSFAGVAGGGVARLIAVHAHHKDPPVEEKR